MVANQFNAESDFLEETRTTSQHKYDGSLHRLLRSSVSPPKVRARTQREMSVLKRRNVFHRSWIFAVINAPKTGTGSFQGSIQKSFGCNGSSKFDAIGKVAGYECPRANLLRTHSADHGKQAVRALQKETPSNRGCMVFTAIRDPQTRLPSYFMEKHKNQMCNQEWAESHTPAQVLEMYKKYLQTDRIAYLGATDEILKEFGSTSLVKDFENMDANGGYTKLTNPDPKGDFQGCELLFLRMEDSANWHIIIESEIPGIEYGANTSREAKCPHIKEHYQALKDYKFTMEEKKSLTFGDPWMEDYFRVYGHDVDHEEEEEERADAEVITKPARRRA